ncbi:MAG: universal stress protein [Planctomycetota bacterium]
MFQPEYERIVLVSDGLKSSEPAWLSAIEIARRHGATVTIVDTVQPPGIAARWLSPMSQEVFELAVAEKEDRLEAVARLFREQEIEVDIEIREGASSVEITRLVIEKDADLVIRYLKGAASSSPGRIGRTARSLVRHCPIPVLLTGGVVAAEPRVLACFDPHHDVSENSSIIEAAAGIAAGAQDLRGLFCWELYGSSLLEKRLDSTTFQQYYRDAEARHREAFDRFAGSHGVAEFSDRLVMHYGDPSTAIPRHCRDNDIDVVVMCSASLNHPLKRLLGSTVDAVMEKSPCAMLIVKPKGFVSRIESADTIVSAGA